MSDEELLAFAQRYQALTLVRDNSDDLIKDLLTHCHTATSTLRREKEQLQVQLQDAQLDLADATQSRREFQQKLRQAEARVGYVTQDIDYLKQRNPYVAILIDGDGLLFKDTFIRQGLEGGKRAAYALRTAILAQCGEHASEMEVMAKQVILGISHDASYAPFLDQILRDQETRQRVTLVEGFPTVRDLQATGVNILNLNDAIFRADKLVERSLASALPTPPVMVSPPTKSSTPASISNNSTSYAGIVTSATPPPTLTMPIPPKNIPTKPSKPAPWNPGARGVDTPLHVNQTALDNIKKRKDNTKLCNNHYLRGPCAKGDSCCFEHKYRPTHDEKVAIAFLARLNPCTNGQDCDVEDCIYGHHITMSHARVEEVEDSDISDPSEGDIDDFDDNDIIRRVDNDRPQQQQQQQPSSLPHRPRQQPTQQQPQQQMMSSSTPGMDFQTTRNPQQYGSFQCLYPCYFDASRSRAEGRRVPSSLAVENPLARAIVDACRHLRLRVFYEPTKLHPKDWANPGRVKVELKPSSAGSQGAQPQHSVKNKHHLYLLVAKYLRANPVSADSPLLWERIPGAHAPDRSKPYPRPAVPRGWKMLELLPYYSPAMTGGGVSENLFKDMMKEMQGGGDMASMLQAAAAAGGAGPSGAGGGGGAIEGGGKKGKKGKK
ncbi:uncharacterized protein E0L32_010530 [Thyridium curvatum]|uniref:C3H1-type domain-containing protein n=1 Tax=Thyridium curvatum TaxID=1093900 RepID=A0A507AS89_9PEZI|nr:uncharacterized protein E0L32_010530 [Thyridium curvatum]TPX07738.1 hypothetical protein E0L32_010530 [Thyridium curvatum]